MPARPLPRRAPVTAAANLHTASAIPRAYTSAERVAKGLPAEVPPVRLASVRPDPVDPSGLSVPLTASDCRALRDRIGEQHLAAYLLTHGDRPRLKQLAASVQSECPRTAPADKRSSHELTSYIVRMLTAGRYIAAFED